MDLARSLLSRDRILRTRPEDCFRHLLAPAARNEQKTHVTKADEGTRAQPSCTDIAYALRTRLPLGKTIFLCTLLGGHPAKAIARKTPAPSAHS